MIPLDDQFKEARRELALRRRCYPGLVTRGTMTEGQAEYYLAAMEAIVQTLARLVAEQSQPSLFTTT
jgi:hypothetical protein